MAMVGLFAHGALRACAHIALQTLTQKGTKSGNILLGGSSLVTCPAHSLYRSFIKMGPSHDQN